MRKLSLIAVLSASIAFGGQASAIVALPTTTFSFTGFCIDCSQQAGGPITTQAQLTLANYTLGSQITANNFVSFTYDGSNLVDATTIADAMMVSAASLTILCRERSASTSTVPMRIFLLIYGWDLGIRARAARCRLWHYRNLQPASGSFAST